MNLLCKSGLRDGAGKRMAVLFSFPRKESDAVSQRVLCLLFPAVRSFAELNQNPTSVFLEFAFPVTAFCTSRAQ